MHQLDNRGGGTSSTTLFNGVFGLRRSMGPKKKRDQEIKRVNRIKGMDQRSLHDLHFHLVQFGLFNPKKKKIICSCYQCQGTFSNIILRLCLNDYSCRNYFRILLLWITIIVPPFWIPNKFKTLFFGMTHFVAVSAFVNLSGLVWSLSILVSPVLIVSVLPVQSGTMHRFMRNQKIAFYQTWVWFFHEFDQKLHRIEKEICEPLVVPWTSSMLQHRRDSSWPLITMVQLVKKFDPTPQNL